MWMHTLLNTHTGLYQTLIDTDNPFTLVKALNGDCKKDIGRAHIEYTDPQWVIIYSYKLSEDDVSVYNYMTERAVK